MGSLRLILKSLKKYKLQAKKYIAIASILWSFCYLLLFDSMNPWFSIIPFIIMIIKGVNISLISGLFLSMLWMLYILILVSPLYFIIGKFVLLSIYVPIIIVYYKSPHEEANIIFLLLQDIFWDQPLLYWIKIMSYIPYQRALEPFYSSITDNIAIGSIPYHPNDACYLKDNKNIGLVINMCREYNGPIIQYEKINIKQLHLPTPDFCEPSYQHILLGVYTAKHFLNQTQVIDNNTNNNNNNNNNNNISSNNISTNNISSNNISTNNGIFIHCKAGRGRSAAMTLCILIVVQFPNQPNEAIKYMLKKRNVIERYVRNFVVVEKFIQRLNECQQNFDQLYKEDYILSK